jgi:polysaccharide biosynthesis protein PslE
MGSRDVSGNFFRDSYRALVRHRRKSALFFVVVVVGTVLVTLFLPRQYRSTGKLFVRLGRENSTLDPTATLGQNPTVAVPISRENEINSVVEILQSRVLLEKVVDALGPAVILSNGDRGSSSEDPASDHAPGGWLQQAGVQIGQIFDASKNLLSQLGSTAGLDDRQRAILRLAKHLTVEAAKKSSVIEISYDGPSPAHCQSVVAKLIDAYLDEHVRLNRTHGSHQFLGDQTHRLRAELSAREAELCSLKNKTGLASPDAQRKMVVARIGRLEDDLLNVETAQAVAQAKVRDLRQKLSMLPDKQVTTETSGFGNEGTDRMRDQFYALQVREKEAQAKYTEDHPRMRQLREQIGASRAILEEEERGRKQVTTEPDRLRQQAALALLSEEPALAALEANAKSLRTQLADAHKELTVLNDNEVRVASLQREVDLREADYRKYSNNLEQARIDQQLEIQRMSNIGIVQPASYEPKPIRPQKALNLLLGLCMGVFGGLALPLVLEEFDGSPTPPDRLPRRLQTPLLARVPRVPADDLAIRRRKVPR